MTYVYNYCENRNVFQKLIFLNNSCNDVIIYYNKYNDTLTYSNKVITEL